jgi:hypothetical protein
MTPDLIAHRKLVLVKQLFQHAIVQSHHYSTPSRILAIITFDLASETLLKAVVGSLDPSKQPSDDFNGLIQQAEQLLKKTSAAAIADLPKIRHVHSLRNDAQHKAKYPSSTDVQDARTYTRDFLSALCVVVWGINFEAISLTDLIQNARVKKHLEDAEKALASANFKVAVEQAAVGLHYTLAYVQSAVSGRLAFKESGSSFASRDIRAALERMQRTLTCVALGLNYADYVKFRQLSPVVHFAPSDPIIDWGRAVTIDQPEAEFVVLTVVDAVLQIEERVGDIEKPFGADGWF